MIQLLRVSLLVSAACAGTALAQPAEAPDTAADAAAVTEAERTLAVWLGHSRSDNIGRTEIAESGTYRSLGLVTGLERDSGRLDAGIDADLEYRSFSEEAYDNETVGTLNARALVDLVGDVFAWNFQESLDQGMTDPFAARGPGNLETINVFTHGPRLDMPFGRTTLSMSAYRSKRRYDESAQIDNDNDHYELSLARQRSTTANYALVASTDETEYVDGLASEYEIDRFFMRINKQQRNGSLTADIGTNEIGSGAQSRRDPLMNFTLTRALSSRSSLSFSAARQFTDSGSQIQSSLDAPGGPDDVLVTTAPFEQKNFGLSYGLQQERTTFSLNFGLGEEDYAAAAGLDNEFESAGLTLSRRLSESIDLGLRYDLYDREFQDPLGATGTEEDSTASTWLNWAVGRRMGLAFGVSRYERSGQLSVDETRTDIRWTYSPTGSTGSTSRSMGR